MTLLKQGMLAFIALSITANSIACSMDGSGGFVPENQMRIPVSMKSANGGLTEEQFNNVITKVITEYEPVIKSLGAELVVERNWTDATVNAYAMQSGKKWTVAMFGGLARHQAITEDGFALVVCHELGHHIGGAPKKAGQWASPWASNEGQADYFATLKCLRKVWLNDDNRSIVSSMKLPEALIRSCGSSWVWNNDFDMCLRLGMAGDSVAQLFAGLRGQSTPAKFDTPDPKVVTKTDDNHPATQCRLDTYLQGALCTADYREDVSPKEEVTGTCHAKLGYDYGLRPLCWFKPSVQ